MSDVVLKKISYGELRDKSYEFKDDRYGIATFFTEAVRQTLLACPGYQKDTDDVFWVLYDGDVVIGRELRFGTRLKVNDEIVWAQSGCAMEVCEEYQKTGAGVLLLLESTRSKGYGVNISAFFTVMRVKLFKKQKITVFEIPQFMKLVNTRFLFESVFKLKGVFLNMSTWIANSFLKILGIPNRIRTKKLMRSYTLKKETIVPEWAGVMATSDEHKYMEYHDSRWLQWNLDYNLNGFPEDIQSFYAVYDHSGVPQGFFMTKERLEKEAGRYRNIIRGTIVEWATSNNSRLSEADLNLLAISTFSPNTSHITTVTVDSATEKRLKKLGFKAHGTFQMSFKDKTGLYTDGTDMSLWRIRFGCCNSIVF